MFATVAEAVAELLLVFVSPADVTEAVLLITVLSGVLFTTVAVIVTVAVAPDAKVGIVPETTLFVFVNVPTEPLTAVTFSVAGTVSLKCNIGRRGRSRVRYYNRVSDCIARRNRCDTVLFGKRQVETTVDRCSSRSLYSVSNVGTGNRSGIRDVTCCGGCRCSDRNCQRRSVCCRVTIGNQRSNVCGKSSRVLIIGNRTCTSSWADDCEGTRVIDINWFDSSWQWIREHRSSLIGTSELKTTTV